MHISLNVVAPVLATFDHKRSGFKLPCKVDRMNQKNICTYTYTADLRSKGLLVKINNCPVAQQCAMKTERETGSTLPHILNPCDRWRGQL
jgi:hypothetical protein